MVESCKLSLEFEINVIFETEDSLLFYRKQQGILNDMYTETIYYFKYEKRKQHDEKDKMMSKIK